MVKLTSRRRGFLSWFVEPYRQIKLGLIFVLINLFFSMSFCGVVGYFFLDVYEVLSVYFRLSPEHAQQVLVKLEKPMFLFLGLSIVFMTTTLLVSVRYTHLIYGPLVSIHKYLDGLLGEGPQDPLVIREGDELQDLAIKINRLGEYLQSGEVTESHAMKEIQTYIDQLLAGKSPNPLHLGGSPEMLKLEYSLTQLKHKVV